MAETRDAAGAPVSGPCPNCGDPTPGNFCPSCGQRRVERRITLRRMLSEAVEDQLSLNAALPRTLRALLFQPGLLSAEYMAGRIQRYVPPFRLYLVSSLLFFLVLSFVTSTDPDQFINISAEPDSVEVAADRGAAARDALDERARSDSLGTVWLSTYQFRSHFPPLDSAVNRKVREFQRMGLRESVTVVLAEMVRRAPTAIFLLLPVFALLLKLLYIRRNRYYVEHFVFGLHTHAFAFLVLTFAVPLSGWAEVIVAVWVPIYFLLAMKRFYGQGWIRTLAKYALLGWIYLMIFGLALTGTLVVAVILV